MKTKLLIPFLSILILASCVQNEIESEMNLDAQSSDSIEKEETIREKEVQGIADSNLRERLTDIQYEVTQNSGTEKAYDNPYWDNYEEGIYVDIVDGTPLFSSTDKYKSNTGWPSFTQPISDGVVDELEDNLLWFTRIEARGSASDSHLGHIFTDGPQDEGGLRYCINSASLKFIPKAEMQEEGLGQYLYLFE